MREFFIRLRIILIALFFIFFVTAFLVFPQHVADAATKLDQQESDIRVLLVLAALLADVVLFFIIYQELRPRRRTAQGLLVRSRGSSAEISFDSVISNLNNQIGKISSIYTANTRIRADRGRVVVEVDIDADESTNVRKKTDEIHREIVKIVEKQMGLRLGSKPLIKFRLMTEPVQINIPSYIPPVDPPAEKKGGFFSREKKSVPEAAPVLVETPLTPISLESLLSAQEGSGTILLSSTEIPTEEDHEKK